MIDNENELDYQIYKSYEVLGLIGKGTYGQVYKVKQKKSQQIFAIKKICDVYQNITDAKRTYRELNYLFQLQHPCIVKLYQVISTSKKTSGPFNRQTNTSRTQILRGLVSQQTNGYSTEKIHDTLNTFNKHNKNVYALFQHIETDLSKALRLCRMEQIQRKYIIYQLLHGLAYLHKSKLIHRDIKPSNILIDSNCDVKICDFGLCRLKKSQIYENHQQNIITEYVASRWYRPPEILLGSSPCNEAIDIWGVGCVMAQLILRQPLFQGGTTMDQLEKIFRLIGLPNQQDISKLETQHAKFILRNFTFSRKNKPQKMNEVLGEASDKQLDLIQKLLKFNNQERFTAQQALKHSFFQEMKDMKYDFESYSFPVKITDHTEPSTFLSQFKSFKIEQKKKPGQKGVKKKEITLQQYQSLIEQLQKVTSRSSNRGGYQYEEKIYKKQDKVLQNYPKSQDQNYSDKYLKQKSTRQSNFLLQHKKVEKQKNNQNYEKINIQNYTILQNYQTQKQHNMNTTNKILNYTKQNRNAYSTNENYGNYHHKQINYKTVCDNFNQKQSKKSAEIIGYNNKKIEENLQQHYGKSFNPFQKPIKKNIKNTINSTQKLGQNQRINSKHDKIDNKKNINKTIKVFDGNYKSKSKLQDCKNNSSLNINSKISSKYPINPQLIDQNHQKYASFSSMSYQINTNQTINKNKNAQNSFKKTNQKDDSLKFKQSSKSKYHSGGSNKIINTTIQLKSSSNLKNQSSLNKNSNKRQRKKSKQLVGTTKIDQNSSKQYFIKQSDNCFSKIQINSKKQIDSNLAYGIKNNGVPKDSNKNSTKDLKKTTTLQKKTKKNATSKSIGKKKSQSKLNQNK